MSPGQPGSRGERRDVRADVAADELLAHHRLEERTVLAPHDGTTTFVRVADRDGVRRLALLEDDRIAGDRRGPDVFAVERERRIEARDLGGDVREAVDRRARTVR